MVQLIPFLCSTLFVAASFAQTTQPSLTVFAPAEGPSAKGGGIVVIVVDCKLPSNMHLADVLLTKYPFLVSRDHFQALPDVRSGKRELLLENVAVDPPFKYGTFGEAKMLPQSQEFEPGDNLRIFYVSTHDASQISIRCTLISDTSILAQTPVIHLRLADPK